MAYEYMNSGNYNGLSGMWGYYGASPRTLGRGGSGSGPRRRDGGGASPRRGDRRSWMRGRSGGIIQRALRTAAEAVKKSPPPVKKPPVKKPPTKRPPKIKPKLPDLPPVITPKPSVGVLPLSPEMAKLKEDVIRRTTQQQPQMPQMPYLDPLTGQYIIPGAPLPGALPPPAPAETPAVLPPSIVPTGIMLPTVMGGPIGRPGAPRGLPKGSLPKPIITPQQARLGTLTAALAAGLLFL